VNEPAEDPVGQASTKVVQYVSLVTMAAEAIAQRRQQQAAAAASTDARAAAALRAQQTSAHTAARLQWQPILDPRRARSLGLADTGLAWAAAQAWRPTDPEAELASDRAQDRLRELRPDVMSRFDRLTGEGLDPVEAMCRVAPFLDRPPAHPGEHVARPPLAAAPAPTSSPAPFAQETAAAEQAGVDTSSSASRQHYIDTGTYLPAGAAVAHDQQADALPSDVAQLHAAATTRETTAAPVLAASVRTPPEVARDGYPEPLTGQVLAGGRVKAKTPDRTAPAAMRSTSLATAARAVSGRRR
jgi:hypothetical protein